jgi:hypothetical protein
VTSNRNSANLVSCASAPSAAIARFSSIKAFHIPTMVKIWTARRRSSDISKFFEDTCPAVLPRSAVQRVAAYADFQMGLMILTF